MDNSKKFFEEIIKTEEAKEVFASIKKPGTEEEVAKTYVEVAAKLGLELSEEEVLAYLEEKKASGEIDDEELSQLSGGGDHTECRDTYRNEENCWWNDGCDVAFRLYDDYLCKYDFNGYYQ